MTRVINSFRGEYHFLSNFYPCTVILDDMEYSSVEHAYQAAKTLDLEVRRKIKEAPTPGQAKKLGGHLKLQMSVPAWNTLKVKIMYDLLQQKFSDPILSKKLVDTDDAELIEGNWWNDTFWGKCGGVGDNRLGILLMMIRGMLKEGGENHDI